MPNDCIRIQDAYTWFRLECQSRGLTQATLDYYQWRIQPWLVWLQSQDIGYVGDITSAHVRRYYIHLHESGNAAHSVHAAARAIRRFCNFCVAEDLLDTSPAAKVAMPVLPNKKLPAFTVDEIRAVVDACETERERAIVLMLLDTGLRAAELVSLSGGDVDMTTGAVHVIGKGRKERVVYLSWDTLKQLRRYYRTGPGWPEVDEPVIRAERSGQRLGRSGLFQLMRSLQKRSGIAHCKPHTFRRTFALTMLRQGCDVYTLQHLMGHADLDMLRKYLAITDEDARTAHSRYSPVAALLK